MTTIDVHGYRLQQPIGFLAKHVEPPPPKPKRTTKKQASTKASSRTSKRNV